MGDLAAHVRDHESLGSYHCPRSLGFCQMPEGYALMQTGDSGHHYWLRDDGLESDIHWNKWAVYKWAKNNTQERSQP